VSHHEGVIAELLAGTWRDPETGQTHGIPIDSIVIADSLAGEEAALVEGCHPGQRVIVVHDPFTRRALGERVVAALGADEFVWQTPSCTPEGVAAVQAASAGYDAIVAVGSGTVSDTVKYATFLDGRTYSVFPTSPMNAYTTPTASVSFDGFKKSLTAHSATGVFFDLGVLANCPPRLVAAAFADVICRTTAQVDWLQSHLLFGTPYTDVAYTLLAYDEDRMIADAPLLPKGDPEALATLTRVSSIMGLTTSFTGTTHVGSMAEHMISHSIDMFAKDHHAAGHPGTSHGEQVGVATLVMSRLQNMILNSPTPPHLHPTVIPRERLLAAYGEETARTMIEATEAKGIHEVGAARLNAYFLTEWDDFRAKFRRALRPTAEIDSAMAAAGCRRTGADLGLSPDFFRQCVRDARFIRDRYTMLDLADDAGLLEPFLETVQ
jgi:glycerol-1-phosphate dehydrogenase [NAD(P)+]